MKADEILAGQAQPREQLLARLRAATPPQHTTRPWQVVRQLCCNPEQPVCGHRWEWTAEWCARRRTARADEVAARFTVRRAER